MRSKNAVGTFALTVRLRAIWTRVSTEYGRLDEAVRAAAKLAPQHEVQGVAIWRTREAAEAGCVPWPVVQDAAATLALDDGDKLAAKYVAMPNDLNFPEPKHTENRQGETGHRVDSCFTYDASDPGPTRPTVTFFEYDAPPARHGDGHIK